MIDTRPPHLDDVMRGGGGDDNDVSTLLGTTVDRKFAQKRKRFLCWMN